MTTLVVTSGPRAGERVELTQELVVGREHADLTIDDPEISRRHAVIRPCEGGVEVEDLGSTNGTRVDGEQIAAAVTVRNGGRVQFGDTVIEVEAIEARDEATRLRERPAAPDETVLRASPPPDATTLRPKPTLPDDTAARPVPQAAAPAAVPPAPTPQAADPPAPAPQAADPPAPTPQAAAAGPPPPAHPVQAQQPFGAFEAPAARRRRGVATRLWVPMVLTFATVAGTAVALILYFAGR